MDTALQALRSLQAEVRRKAQQDKSFSALANLALEIAACGESHWAMTFNGTDIDINHRTISPCDDGTYVVTSLDCTYCNGAHWACQEIERETSSANEAFEMCGQFDNCDKH